MSEAVIAQAEEFIDARESRRSRWFFILFFSALSLSVGATFYRVFVARDYLIIVETTCDPSVSVCFARDICETEDGMCAEGNVPVETSYYKIVERKAFAFAEECTNGSLEDEVCADLSCRPNEADCSETFCSGEIVPEGEVCLGPGVVIEAEGVEGIDLESGGVAEGANDTEMSEETALPIENNMSEGATDGGGEQGMEGGERSEGRGTTEKGTL